MTFRTLEQCRRCKLFSDAFEVFEDLCPACRESLVAVVDRLIAVQVAATAAEE